MKRVLFCRSGGGLPGLDIHAGIWQALAARGIVATACHGTSAGAIVSALDAAERDAQSVVSLVKALSSKDVVDYRFAWRTRSGFLANICHGQAMLKVLSRCLPSTFPALAKPIAAWATQANTSRRINVFRPTIAQSPAEACAMSASIPAIFPPIRGVDGLQYVDGGMRFNLPLPADWHAYDEVWLLIATGTPSPTDPAGTTLGNILRVFRHLMADQILDVLDQTHGAPTCRVIWPQLKTPGMLDFDHALIDQARVETLNILNHMENPHE